MDRYSDALDSFRHLILTQPQKGATWAMVGLCEVELRDYERALEDLEKARTLGLGENQMLSTVARYNDAILLNRFEKFEEAYQVLHQFAVEPNDDASIIEAMGLNALRMPFLPSEIPPDKRELVLMTGRAAFAMASRTEDGDKLFRELLARYPIRARSANKRGRRVQAEKMRDGLSWPTMKKSLNSRGRFS